MKPFGFLNKTHAEEEDKQLADAFRLMMMINFHPDLEFILSQMVKLKYFNQFISKYFQNTTQEKLVEFCGRFKMEHFSAGDIIFQEGDPSNDKFYIIYYGSVLLLRSQKMEQLQVNQEKDMALERREREELSRLKEEEEKEQEQKISMQGLVAAQRAAQKFLMGRKKGLSYSEREELIGKYGDILRTYVRGDGFGEMALMRNVRRSLTIAASSSDLFLVVLKKEGFAQLQAKIEDEIKEKQHLIFQVFSSKHK